MNLLVPGPLKANEGSTLIEFALISFTFIMLLLGVLEMGRMILVYNTVANSARAGARYAIVHGGERTGSGTAGASGPGSSNDPNATQVKTVVQNFAGAGLMNTSMPPLSIVVSYPNGTNTAGSRVTVTVSYPYDPLVTFFNPLLSNTLSSTSQGVITF